MRSPVVPILQGLEEAEDDTSEVDPSQGYAQNDNTDDDGEGISVRVDEGQNAPGERHNHVEESKEHPRQEQESSFLRIKEMYI